MVQKIRTQRKEKKEKKKRKSKKIKRLTKKNRTHKKLKNTRNKKHKIHGGSIDMVSSNLQFMLALNDIEFLPSTRILDHNYKHYIQMIDYITLQNIINNSNELKKSPTIQELFNIKKYNVNNKGLVFDYKNIKCDNLIDKHQRNYTLRLLFLYLLECNLYKEEGRDIPPMVTNLSFSKSKRQHKYL